MHKIKPEIQMLVTFGVPGNRKTPEAGIFKIMEITKEKCRRKGHDVSGGLEDVQNLSFTVKVQTRHMYLKN